MTGGDGSAALAGGAGAGAVLSVVLRARGEALGVLQLLFAERERADAASADVALTVFATRVAEALAARAASVASRSSWPMRARSAMPSRRPASRPRSARWRLRCGSRG